MIKKERTNVYDFNFHLVWVTKYRKTIFTTSEKSDVLKAMLEDVAERNDVEIENMEVMTDTTFT